MAGVTSRSELTARSHSTSDPTGLVVATPTTFIPPRRAASIPAKASSMTMEEEGSRPRKDAALRKTSGSQSQAEFQPFTAVMFPVAETETRQKWVAVQMSELDSLIFLATSSGFTLDLDSNTAEVIIFGRSH